jgi:5,6-dimethylbenzimidazole synthase
MDYDTLLEAFKKRRSIRKFKNAPVPEEYIDKILEAGRWAPSGANAQPWEFMVIRKAEIKQSIGEILTKQFAHMTDLEMTKPPELRVRFRVPAVGESVFILPFGDMRTLDITNVYARITRGVEIFTCDMDNAFMYMVLAANSLGLGARWSSAVTCPYSEVLIKELLGIPRQFILFDMLVVGYADEEPVPRLVRDRNELVHYDGYDKSKYRTDQQVKDFLILSEKTRRKSP